MTEQNTAAKPDGGKQSLEETLREALVAGFAEALHENTLVTDEQTKKIQNLIQYGTIAPRDLLGALRTEGEAGWNE